MVTSEELVGESRSRPLTVKDLEQLPDDGRQYELIDGMLIVNAAPINIHQIVVGNLEECLRLSAHALRTHIVMAGNGLAPDDHNVYVHDVSVVRTEDLQDRYQHVPPDLVAEVVSPGTALYDRGLKRERYARFGVPHYWIVLPDQESPELLAYDLVSGQYKQVAHVTGDEVFATEQPFPVRVAPSQLVELYPEWWHGGTAVSGLRMIPRPATRRAGVRAPGQGQLARLPAPTPWPPFRPTPGIEVRDPRPGFQGTATM